MCGYCASFVGPRAFSSFIVIWIIIPVLAPFAVVRCPITFLPV